MRRFLLSRLAPIVLVLATVAVLAAEQPASDVPKPAPKSPSGEKKSAAESPKKKDPVRLPAEAIYVIAEQAADALRMLPRAIVVPPEKYKEWMDEIERLKAQVRPDRPQPPFRCLLKGKVEGNAAQLQAQFECPTDRAGVVVALACNPARATNITSTGSSPALRADAEGFSAQIDQPGKHTLTLDLVAELSGRGGSRTLGLDLPRAAITRIELELPPGMRDVRLNGKPIADIAGAAVKGNRLEADLGAAARLDIGWRDAVGAGAGTPLLTADGRIFVRADERQVTTTAELTLRAQGVGTKEWRLLVPPGAEIRAVDGEAGVQAFEPADAAQASLRTVRLKEPNSAPLKLAITTRAPLPRPGTRLALGPFQVVGATRHTGTVLVANAAADVRLLLHPLSGLTRIETRDPAYLAAYSYQAAGPDRPPAATVSMPPWLELESESIRGLVEARVVHVLRLQRETSGRFAWRATTTIDATPVRTGVEYLEVQLPPQCTYDERRGPRPAELVRDVEVEMAKRVVRFRLANDPLKAFQLTFETTYGDAVAENGKAALMLPKVLDVRDRGGLVTLVAPEEFEITLPPGANPALELASQEPQKVTMRSERIPERAEFAWQPYRPEVRARAEADLNLSGREGSVRHSFHLEFPQATPSQITLNVPEPVAASLQVSSGGELVPVAKPATTRHVKLQDVGAKELRLVLEYSFALPARASNGPLAIPLVVASHVLTSETKLRVWSDPGQLPIPAGTTWTESNIEEVKGRDRLPVLVLRSPRADAPLMLRFGELRDGDMGSTVIIARALVRVTVSEGGQSYHASYLLRQLAAPWLELELPAPPATIALRVSLDGKQVDWEASSEEPRTARLRLSTELIQRSASLDVRYQVPFSSSGTGLVQGRMQPPIVRGASPYVPTRWSFALPAGWIVLAPETGPGVERTWGRRGWLLRSRLAIAPAELERWFAGADLPLRADAETAPPPSHVCWRNGPASVTLMLVTQQAWFFLCSLGLLAIGFVLDQLSRPAPADPLRPSAWFLPALAMLALALAIVWLLYPTLLSAILTGSQFGAVVLAGYLTIQWVRRERYRRQVVFLSSFARGPRGSSLSRKAGSSIRPRSEPSTVDAPPNDPGAVVEGGS